MCSRSRSSCPTRSKKNWVKCLLWLARRKPSLPGQRIISSPSPIVMTVRGGSSPLGLQLLGFVGFAGAVGGGLWLVRANGRSSHGRDAGEDQ